MPQTLECPQCHVANPPGSPACVKCATPLPFDPAATSFDDATIAGSTPADVTVVGTTPAPRPGAPPAPRSGGADDWTIRTSPAATSIPVPATSFEPGTVLGGRYEIIKMLGEGGMGAVYKARDTELDRLVALKVIRPELANQPQILQRFKQELILARKVTHRNVIRIFDLGQAGGIKFITMEFVEGRDLKGLLTEKGKLSGEEAVAIMHQVCLALEAAHQEGVVHRDLKPQNIMVEDATGRVLVMDFGIARSIEPGGMTQTGALIGTPEYMSPEQVRGKEADARSDIFTLGIILYELLTGQMPYKADTALGSMYKRTKERALPPIAVNPEVPGFLSDLVSRCLDPEPQRRFQSTREIIHEFEAWRGGAARDALAPIRDFLRRVPPYQKWLAVGLTAGLVITLGFFALRGRFSLTAKNASSSTAPPAVSLAVLPFRNASGDPSVDWLGASLAEMLRTDVGQSAALRTVSADRVHQIMKDLRIAPNAELDPDTRRRLAEFSNSENIVYGQYFKIGDQIRIDATLEDLKRQRTFPLKVEASSENDILTAVEQLAHTLQQNLALSPDLLKDLRAKSFKPSSRSVQALRFYNEGLELSRMGNNTEAARRFESSIQQDAEFALAYTRLGQTYSALGYDDKAEENSRRSVELSASLPPHERYLILANHARIQNDYPKAIEAYENLVKVSPDDPEVLFNLAGLYESAGSLDKASDALTRVLTRDPKFFDALFAAGRVQIKRGDPQASLDFLNRALNLSIQLGNEEGRATILNATGIAYKRLNKPDEALRNYQESLDIRTRLGLKGGMAATLNEIGQIQNKMGQPDKAFKSYQQSLKLRREIGDKRGTGNTLIDLGLLYVDRGRYDDALKLFQESLQIQRQVGNESSQALCLNNIGNIYLARGQYSDALTYYERALQLSEKTENPAEMAVTVHNLAETTAKLGEYNQSLDYFLRALNLFRKADDKRGAATASYSMGTLFDYQGRFGASLTAKEEALKTFRDLQERSFWLAEILSGYGESLAQVGRYDEAQKTLHEALSLSRELQNKALIAQTLNFQGDLAYFRSDFKSAGPLFQRALEAANGAGDRRMVLLARVNLARVAIAEKRPQPAIASLQAVAQQAGSLGLQYLAAESSLLQAEALLDTGKSSAARPLLDSTLRTAERLNLQALAARAHFQLARFYKATGNAADAQRQSREASRILGEIRAEARTDAILQRADLRPLSSTP